MAGKQENNYQYAIFAGGCFWCMVPPFQSMDGVVEVIAGYIGIAGYAKLKFT
ncbi:MAG TPA: peptide-methionine (S)-S-oxide reductase [Clostridiales bacterium]|nr:peptide-methionine (S)-S-oxide reductase [Clostridiales bacterium]